MTKRTEKPGTKTFRELMAAADRRDFPSGSPRTSEEYRRHDFRCETLLHSRIMGADATSAILTDIAGCRLPSEVPVNLIPDVIVALQKDRRRCDAPEPKADPFEELRRSDQRDQESRNKLRDAVLECASLTDAKTAVASLFKATKFKRATDVPLYLVPQAIVALRQTVLVARYKQVLGEVSDPTAAAILAIELCKNLGK